MRSEVRRSPSDSSRWASARGSMRSSLGSELRRSAGPYITIPSRNIPSAGPLDPAEALGALHTAPWGEAVALSPFFTIEKLHSDLTECTFPEGLSVIYYDAFSPDSQPELWAEELFARLFAVALPEAVLTTYCAKGEVRRRLQRAGFLVDRLPGPPGKREVLRARVPR